MKKEKILKLVDEKKIPFIHDLISRSEVNLKSLKNDSTFEEVIVLKKGTDPNFAKEFLYANWVKINETGRGTYIAQAIIDVGDYKGYPALYVHSLPDFTYYDSIMDRQKEIDELSKLSRLKSNEVKEIKSVVSVDDKEKVFNEEYSAIEIENMIQKVEGIRCILRTDAYKHQFSKKYDYKKKASDSITLGNWYQYRLLPIIGSDVEFEVVKGDNSFALRSNTLQNIRNSYASDMFSIK